MKAKKSFSVLLSSVMAVSMVPLSSFTTVAENGSTDREFLTEKLPFTPDLLEEHYNYSGKDFSISADDYYGSYDSYGLAGDGASIRANGDYTIIKSVDAVIEYGAGNWDTVIVTPDTAVKSSVSDNMVTVTDINSDSLNLCESGGTVYLSDVTVYYLDYAGVFEAYEYDSNVGMWDFTYASWKTESNNYYTAVDAICNIVYDFEDGRFDAAQSELDEAVEDYYAVLDRLEERPPVDPENVAGNDDYAALEDALDAGNKISRNEYTEESSSALSAALSYAMDVYYAAYGVEMSVPVQFSKDEIAAAVQAVNDAIDALEPLSDAPSANYEELPFSVGNIDEYGDYSYEGDNFTISATQVDGDGTYLDLTVITSKNDALMIDKVEMVVGWHGEYWSNVTPSSGTKLETGNVDNGTTVTITDVNDYDLRFIDHCAVQVKSIKVYYKQASAGDYESLRFSNLNLDKTRHYSCKSDNFIVSARKFDDFGTYLDSTVITSNNDALMIDKVEMVIGWCGYNWGDVTPSSGTKLETRGVDDETTVTITDVNDYDLSFSGGVDVQVKDIKVYYKEAPAVDYERLPFKVDNIDESDNYSYSSDNFTISAAYSDGDGTRLDSTVITSKNDALMIDKVEMFVGYGGSYYGDITPSSGTKLETDGVEDGTTVTITDVNDYELSFIDPNYAVQVRNIKVYYKEVSDIDYERLPFSKGNIDESENYSFSSNNFTISASHFDPDGTYLYSTVIKSKNDALMIDKVEMVIGWLGLCWGVVTPSSGTKLETDGVEDGTTVTITDVNDYELSFIDPNNVVQVKSIKVYYKEAPAVDYERLLFSKDNISGNGCYSYSSNNFTISAAYSDPDGTALDSTSITSKNDALMIDKVEMVVGWHGEYWGDVIPSSGTKLETDGVEDGTTVTITDVDDYELSFISSDLVQVKDIKVYYKEAPAIDYERLPFKVDNIDESECYSYESDNFTISAAYSDPDGTYLDSTVITSKNDALMIDKVEMVVGLCGECWGDVTPSSGTKLETEGVDDRTTVTITDVNDYELSFIDHNGVQVKSIKVYYKEAPADYTELDDAVENAEALDETMYTADSWTALQTALDAAKGVSRDLIKADQSVVDTAKNALDAAVSGLVYLPYDYSFLYSAIEYAELLKAEDFTSESWTALQTALDAAKGVSRDLTVADGESADIIAASLYDALNGLELLFVENSLIQAPTINEAGLYDHCIYYYDTNNDKVIYKEDKNLAVEFADWYLRTAVQTRVNIPESANYEDTTLDLRFISMLDENLSDYQEAGFVFTINGVEVDKKLSTKTVVNSFIVDGDTVDISCYSEADDYFFILTYTLTYDEVKDCTLNDIPLTVTPYVILVNGEKVEGNTVEFLLADLMY